MSDATPDKVEAIPVADSGWLWLPLGLLLLGADQLTKWLVARSVALYEMITLLPVLDITHAHNVGAAFNFLARAGGWQRWFFTALALGVGGAIVYYLRRLNARAQPLQCAGLSLIAAGAIGNMVDRLRLGYVVDFIHVHWGSAEFPSFNVADSCITIGAGLIILESLLEARRSRKTL